MSAFEVGQEDNGDYFVKGDLTFHTLNKKTIKSYAFLKSSDEIYINLEKVKSADSAGLALMIEWIKLSKLYNTKLTFKNIPQQLLTLANLSSIETFDFN